MLQSMARALQIVLAFRAPVRGHGEQRGRDGSRADRETLARMRRAQAASRALHHER
jgi:hypothetical protein